MNFRYINKKLFISTYLLCGVLSLSGCSVLNNIEENYEFVVPIQDFIVNSEMLGKINVHIEEKEGSVIYVDYLNKTLEWNGN